MKLSHFLLALTLCAVALWRQAPAAPMPEADSWVSLYLGREANFQSELTEKIRSICDSYGVPYQVTTDRKILVPLKARSSILMLIAGHYKK